jgi:alkyl hydroperoxide reductase subunit AhpF
MGLLRESDKSDIARAFGELSHPVRVILFTETSDSGESEPNQIARELAEEVVQLSPKLSLEQKDLRADAELAKSHGIDKTPAMVVLGEKDHGLLYYGVPAGHEFSGFIESLIGISRGEHGLPGAVVEQLAKVDQPVRIEVLFTPT